MTRKEPHLAPFVSLGEIAEFRNGVNFVSSQRGRGIPVINVKDFKDRAHPDFSDLEELKAEAVRLEALLQAGDTLFVRSNGNKELIGRSMHLRNAPPRPTTHSAFTIRMRLTSPAADPLYCAYYLRGGAVRQTLSAQGSGTNISNLNQDILSRLQIWLPSLRVQRRIASILSAYDDLIEVNEHRSAVLEEITRRLFEEWFVRFRFPDHHMATFSDDIGRRIPSGWTPVEVKELVNRKKSGATYRKEDCEPSGAVIVVDQSAAPLLGFHSNSPDHVASPKDPLIIFGDHTCKMQLLTTPFSVGQNTIVFSATTRAPTYYLFALIRELTKTREYKRHWNELIRKEVLVAPRKLMDAYDKVVRPFFETIEKLTELNRSLRLARDLLLPKLISGEIDLERVGAKMRRAAERVAAE